MQFLALQTQNHPDKFVSASPADQRAAQQRSALVNDAYAVLAAPVTRAAYIIENTSGENPFSERNTKMPMAFLEKQLELREALARHRDKKDSAALVEMENALERACEETELKLATYLDDAPDMARAAIEARKLRFESKLLEEIQAEIG
jgi:molecular chaperone HscB